MCSSTPNSSVEVHLTHDAHCKAMIALLCEGRSDFIDIETHKHDPVFKESLALEKVLSEPSVRQRLGEAAIYGAENIDLFLEEDRWFIIKRNPRKEHPTRLISNALAFGDKTCIRGFSPTPALQT